EPHQGSLEDQRQALKILPAPVLEPRPPIPPGKWFPPIPLHMSIATLKLALRFRQPTRDAGRSGSETPPQSLCRQCPSFSGESFTRRKIGRAIDRTGKAHEGLSSVFPLRALQFFTHQPANGNSRLARGALKPVGKFFRKVYCDCVTHDIIVTHFCTTVLH